MKQACYVEKFRNSRAKWLLVLALVLVALMLGVASSRAQENPVKRELLLQRQALYAAMVGVKNQILHLENEYQKILMGLAEIDRALIKIDTQD